MLYGFTLVSYDTILAIQYAKRQQQGSGAGLSAKATYLPLKVNAAGVIPVIFAMAFFMLPKTLTLFFPEQDWAQTVTRYADPSHNIGMIVYVILIIAFAYFYAFVQVNPEKMSDNLKNKVVMYRVLDLANKLKNISLECSIV